MSTTENGSSDEVVRPLSSAPEKPAPPPSFTSESSSSASVLPAPPPPPAPVTSSTSSTPPVYSTPAQPERTSAWEKVDKVASVGEAVVGGIGTVIMKLYGVALIIGGIAMLIGLNNPSRFIGLLIAAYGVYLVLPGNKWVVY